MPAVGSCVPSLSWSDALLRNSSTRESSRQVRLQYVAHAKKTASLLPPSSTSSTTMNNSPTTQMIARWAMLRPQKDLIAPPTHFLLDCGESPHSKSCPPPLDLVRRRVRKFLLCLSLAKTIHPLIKASERTGCSGITDSIHDLYAMFRSLRGARGVRW